MTMLGNNAILKEMERGNIKIDPFKPEHLGTNSYDLTLGRWIYLVYRLPAHPQFYPNDATVYYGPVERLPGTPVVVPHNGTLLAMSGERIATGPGLVGLIRNRSTTRREGVSVAMDAGLGDVGYGWPNGTYWTFELSAHLGSSDTVLTAGERICQIHFERVEDATITYTGQYAADDWPLCMVPKRGRDFIRPYTQMHADGRLLEKLRRMHA